MTTTLQHAKPKTLAAGEGDTHPLLTHTLIWKVTASDTDGHYAMFEMMDTSGGSAPVHSHPWEETFYILEGEIELQVGNRREKLSAGATGHVPANAVHAFTVTSAIARVLVIISSATAEAFYREAGAKLKTLPPEPIVVQALSAKYGFRLQA
jgi:quercetin dioxygenase-like cupin family protein